MPSLLFLDSFCAHLTTAVQSAFVEANTTVRVIPGRCTSVLQPLEQASQINSSMLPPASYNAGYCPIPTNEISLVGMGQ